MKTQRLEKYSERFDNKDNELVQGVFNPNTWGKRMVEQESLEEAKDLAYYKANAEEDYLAVPISVLRYISQLEQQERSYNLDDLKEAFFMGRVGKTIKDFNEQFKNK